MAKVTYKDISVNKIRGGYYLCSAMVNGYLVERKYLYYTKREARYLFHKVANSEGVS